MTATILQRKIDHLETVLHRDVTGRVDTGFASIRFEHQALPEINFDDIDLGTEFLGRQLAAPLLVSSMTGGPNDAARINATIAEMAQELKLAFGVGSQRIALEGPASAGLDHSLRRRAPDVPILANIGAAQLNATNALDLIRRTVGMIEADALIVHLNPLQEILQAGGDRNWSGLLARLAELVRVANCPIVVKEVGCGISGAVAHKLWNIGVRVIDVAGAGGTSWAAVEADRAEDAQARALAESFRNWGIPTARSLVMARQACPDATLIASGGIRNGHDVAAAIRLGADLCGFAAAILPAALAGPDALTARFRTIIAELRVIAFCTGSTTLADLRNAALL